MTRMEKFARGNVSQGVNKVLYVSFVVFSLLVMSMSGIDDGWPMLGIALIFDPFDQEVRWDRRPWYQRAILLTHLAAVFVLGGISIFR